MLYLLFWLPIAFGEPTGLPPASSGAQNFLSEVSVLSAFLKDSGPLCDGGGRKWAKIQTLKILIQEHPVIQEIERQLVTLNPSCRAVAQTSDGHFDFDGTRPVIRQRVARSNSLNRVQKQQCLRFWADWEATESAREQALEVLRKWSDDCVPPAADDAPNASR